MASRSATVRSFAKINLDLRVLYRRADNYHELRTIFQTISLADTIHIRCTPARRTRITVEGNAQIPDNLIVRAAQALLDKARTTAAVEFGFKKRIPMGAGLGGGSSNAAAVLLALPVLAGLRTPFEQLTQIAAGLGSDVPFFLYGGTALGVGRGEELYPLPDMPARRGLLLAPAIHSSTAEAYAALNRPALTSGASAADTKSFQRVIWALAGAQPGVNWEQLCVNEFEPAVFKRHPALGSLKRALARSGASPASMTGSGSALFGFFDSQAAAGVALETLRRAVKPGVQMFPIAVVSRGRYRSLWRRQLSEYIDPNTPWPPRNRS